MTRIILTPPSTDFFVGTDSFADLEINGTSQGSFYYFKNTKKGSIVKRFVLKKTGQSQKNCEVTLIKKGETGKFEPRFDFEILDLTSKVVQTFNLPIQSGEDRLVKAKVDLGDCHKELSNLLSFIENFESIELAATSFAVVTKDEKEELSKVLEKVDKDVAVSEFAKKYDGKLSEKDLAIMAGRKKNLDWFSKFLTDPSEFDAQVKKLGANKRPEDLWQAFFERYRWIFGYGLQLVCCEGLDEHKLETTIVGNDIIDGAGKRTDALLKTRGRISKTIFCEIKTHRTQLLKEDTYRPGTYVPSDELVGAVAQVQKTIHKASLKLTENFKRISNKEGVPTGEEIAFIRPRGMVVIGMLDEFSTDHGINQEQYASFELYRQQLVGIDILTFDELYERTRFIVEE